MGIYTQNAVEENVVDDGSTSVAKRREERRGCWSQQRNHGKPWQSKRIYTFVFGGKWLCLSRSSTVPYKWEKNDGKIYWYIYHTVCLFSMGSFAHQLSVRGAWTGLKELPSNRSQTWTIAMDLISRQPTLIQNCSKCQRKQAGFYSIPNFDLCAFSCRPFLWKRKCIVSYFGEGNE